MDDGVAHPWPRIGDMEDMASITYEVKPDSYDYYRLLAQGWVVIDVLYTGGEMTFLMVYPQTERSDREGDE